jgi:mRNA interferase MazF
VIERGDIRWFRFERPDKRRPVLVLGRRAAVPALSQIVVVPFSTTIRGVAGEVVLDERDGLAVRSTIKVEWIRAVDRTAIGPRIAGLPPGRWPEVKRAVVHVLGLDEE